MKIARIVIGYSQFRHVGGGGGADPEGLSPGGGGFACLLMSAPCDAQYAGNAPPGDHQMVRSADAMRTYAHVTSWRRVIPAGAPRAGLPGTLRGIRGFRWFRRLGA